MAQPDRAARTRPKDSDRTADTSSPAAPAEGSREREGVARRSNTAPPNFTDAADPGADARTDAQQAPNQPDDHEDRRTRIEHQAYLLYLQRGGAPGSDLEDWLAAERQVDARHD